MRRGVWRRVADLLVLLDANALMMPFQFSLDLDGELSRLLGEVNVKVPSSVLRELQALASSDPQARAALQLAERYPTLPAEGRGDDALLAVARDCRAAVVTNDRRLRGRLRDEGLPVIYLRGKQRLAAEGLPLR